MKEIKQQVRQILFGAAAFVGLLLVFSGVIDSETVIRKGPKEYSEPLFTMIDLGYDNSEILDSYISSLNKNKNTIGKLYSLKISTYNEELSPTLNLDIYDLNDNITANDFFKDIIEREYTEFKKFESNCIGSNCYFPTIKYENAIENMIVLKSEKKSYDAIYSIYDIENSTNNIIFLSKDNKIVVIKIFNISVTKEMIDIIINKINSY